MEDNWQQDVAPEDWEKWQLFAKRHAAKEAVRRGVFGSLGPEDYAATAIELLWKQQKRPPIIEGWLGLTINRMYIHRHRKIMRRGGLSEHNLDEEGWETEMVTYTLGGPSAVVLLKLQVAEILNLLTSKEQEMLSMSVAGYDNHEIANLLGFKSNKIVATRLKQISKKIKSFTEPESR